MSMWMKRWWEKIAIFYFNKNEIDASKLIVFYSDELEAIWGGGPWENDSKSNGSKSILVYILKGVIISDIDESHDKVVLKKGWEFDDSQSCAAKWQ